MSAEIRRFNGRQYGSGLKEVQVDFVITREDCSDEESIKLACARALLKDVGLLTESVEIEEYNALLRERSDLSDLLAASRSDNGEKDALIKSLENGINRMQGELTSLSGKLSKATSRADSFEAEARGKDKVIAEQSARLSAFFVKTAKLEEECVNHQLAYLNERDCADAIRFHRDLNASVANHATTENVKLQEEVASLLELNEDLGTINKAYRDLIDAKNEQLVEGEFVQPEAVVLNECVVNVFVNHGLDISSIVAKAINSKFDK